MNYLIPIIVCIAVAVISYYLGYIKSKTVTHKVTEDDIISSMKAEFVNKLHPFVVYIYKMFINKDEIKLFKIIGYNLRIYMDNSGMSECIEIWAENDYYNRRFNIVPIEILKINDCTINELNKQLSNADKKVLDHIVQAIKINNKEFIDRLFIS